VRTHILSCQNHLRDSNQLVPLESSTECLNHSSQHEQCDDIDLGTLRITGYPGQEFTRVSQHHHTCSHSGLLRDNEPRTDAEDQCINDRVRLERSIRIMTSVSAETNAATPAPILMARSRSFFDDSENISDAFIFIHPIQSVQATWAVRTSRAPQLPQN
jgi:hypothetical protein